MPKDVRRDFPFLPLCLEEVFRVSETHRSSCFGVHSLLGFDDSWDVITHCKLYFFQTPCEKPAKEASAPPQDLVERKGHSDTGLGFFGPKNDAFLNPALNSVLDLLVLSVGVDVQLKARNAKYPPCQDIVIRTLPPRVYEEKVYITCHGVVPSSIGTKENHKL